jgi:hypothetical protein
MAIVNILDAQKPKTHNAIWRVKIEDYTYELHTGNFVLVYKGSSSIPTYEITAGKCSCRAGQYGSACKHTSALTFCGDQSVGPVNEQARTHAKPRNDSEDIIENTL